MTRSAAAIAQALTAVLSPDQIIPYRSWSDTWYMHLKTAYVGDVQSLWMVLPQTVQDLSAVMSLAHQHHWQVLIAGQGTKLAWGALARGVDLLISTQNLNRLIDHAVGDMTVTVEAGMRFSDLQVLLAQQRQWLPLDPNYPEEATLGGILATRDTGSLRHRYGSIRDLCLGLTLVRSDGQIAKAGGRVVKNVAGYDLMKLFTGSYGTLGIVTEMTLRAYPLSEAAGTVLVTGNGLKESKIADFTQQLLQSTLTPTAVDVLGQAHLTVAVRFQGLPASVSAQMARVKTMAQSQELRTECLLGDGESQWWTGSAAQFCKRSGCEHSGQDSILCQIGVLPVCSVSSLATLQKIAADQSIELQGKIQAGSGLGLLHLVGQLAEAETVLRALRSHCEQASGFLAVLEAPVILKQTLDPWGYSGSALAAMRKLKERFDPRGLLNSGRFVGGI